MYIKSMVQLVKPGFLSWRICYKEESGRGFEVRIKKSSVKIGIEMRVMQRRLVHASKSLTMIVTRAMVLPETLDGG